MSFLKPKIPTPTPPPNPANPAIDASRMPSQEDSLMASTGSLISTSARGLRRRATTQRGSLIGGG